MLCKICNKPLNVSQYNSTKSLKSCPKCSVNNGQEHVYFSYPTHFGQTELRATPNNPDGPQSYCVPCRSGRIPYNNFVLCSSIANNNNISL